MVTKKRAPYKRRFHKPMFGGGLKTTTKDGYTVYMREYMKAMRELTKQEKLKL